MPVPIIAGAAAAVAARLAAKKAAQELAKKAAKAATAKTAQIAKNSVVARKPVPNKPDAAKTDYKNKNTYERARKSEIKAGAGYEESHYNAQGMLISSPQRKPNLPNKIKADVRKPARKPERNPENPPRGTVRINSGSSRPAVLVRRAVKITPKKAAVVKKVPRKLAPPKKK
jgi:hypothetical protein